MRQRTSKDEQIRLIMECRKSGLSDYQWCKQKDINPANFYNWMNRLKKSGFALPESTYNTNSTPSVQEVVKLDVVDSIPEPIPDAKQNTNNLSFTASPVVAAEITIGNATIRLYNDASPTFIHTLLQMIGGSYNAW